MRAVAAVRHQPGLAIAADLAGDDAELQLAAVFVVLALDRLHRHRDTGQPAVGVHRLESRCHPGVGPEAEGAVDIVAVILRELLAQVAGGERRARASDGLDADRFVDRMRRQGHDRAQRLRVGGGIVQCDRAAVAVADQHAILDAEGRQQAWQDVVGLDLHVAEPRIGRPGARFSVAGAVVDDAGAARGVTKPLGKVAPHLDAAQPLVQEDQHRAVEAVILLGLEPPHPQAAIAEIDHFIGGRHRPLFSGAQAPVKTRDDGGGDDGDGATARSGRARKPRPARSAGRRDFKPLVRPNPFLEAVRARIGPLDRARGGGHP